MQEVVIDLFLTFKLSVVDLGPGALLEHLTSQTVLDGRVEQGQVDAPHLVWGFCRVLLVPYSKQRLIGKIHWSVDKAITITLKRCLLTELIEHSRELLFTNKVVQSAIVEIVVDVGLAIDIWTEFHELGLDVFVGDIHHIGAIVEVLIPVDADVVRAWDTSPVRLIFHGELGALFGCCRDHAFHYFGCKGACEH